MGEQDTDHGDGEISICHVCDREFTQAELLKHLEDAHPDDLLPDPADT